MTALAQNLCRRMLETGDDTPDSFIDLVHDLELSNQNIPGSGPTELYAEISDRLGARNRRKLRHNGYLVRSGPDSVAVRYHATDVVIAYADGRIVVDSGGWRPGGAHAEHGWSAPAGATTKKYINDNLDSGWQIFKKGDAWYWWNMVTGAGSDSLHGVLLPFSDGDTISADGTLHIQATPVLFPERKKPRRPAPVAEGAAPRWSRRAGGVYADLSRWPRRVDYYAKCPKCGSVHGSYRDMAEALAKAICGACNVETVNKLKQEIEKVVTDPQHKPKALATFAESTSEPDGDNGDDGDDSPATGTKVFDEIAELIDSNWIAVARLDLAAEFKVELGDIEITSRGFDEFDPDAHEEFEFDVAGSRGSYRAYKNYDAMYDAAVRQVRRDLEDDPTLFNPSFIEQHIDKKKLLDILNQDDPYGYFSEEYDNMDYEELLQAMCEAGAVESDDARFFDEETGDALPETPELYRTLQEIKDNYVEENKPRIRDPLEYMEEIYGKQEAVQQAIRLAGVDIQAAADDAVGSDGPAHFLSSYDGSYTDLPNGSTYMRIN